MHASYLKSVLDGFIQGHFLSQNVDLCMNHIDDNWSVKLYWVKNREIQLLVNISISTIVILDLDLYGLIISGFFKFSKNKVAYLHMI